VDTARIINAICVVGDPSRRAIGIIVAVTRQVRMARLRKSGRLATVTRRRIHAGIGVLAVLYDKSSKRFCRPRRHAKAAPIHTYRAAPRLPAIFGLAMLASAPT